ncbi:MAG: bifunctional diaminohydroxyphosphoribosylaminopyrimidine deaminase/5-amino-6-(5-phosphoribosylamino)uracil reductase RibD [Gammaproteobacteria bacterium]
MTVDARADHRFLAAAFALARRGLNSTRPNPRVGCVIVRDGEVVGRGFHHHAGGPHAEIVALGAAGARAHGATVYVTLEPCNHHGRTPPCVDALIAARVARVVYAGDDPHPRVAGQGAARLRAAGIEVARGTLAAAARELNRGFLSRYERGRPWVTLKTGISLDGRTALANGESQWITGPAARADVQRLRARSCAVMTGVGTVLADDPALTVRDARYDLGGCPPARVVLDAALAVPPTARLFADPAPVIVFTASAEPARRAALAAAGASFEPVPAATGGGVELAAVLARLAARECNEVLVECGPRLAGALVSAGFVDELVCYVAPRLLGAGARGAFDWPDLTELGASPGFEFVEVRRIGADLRMIARPVPA